MNNYLLRSLLESKIVSQNMSQVREIRDLTDSDEGMQVVSSQSLSRMTYKQGSSGSGSDNRLRISIPEKRRQIGYPEFPNFETQYIQNINIPTAVKTEGDNDGASQNHDDNYHFLMSLLPYLREVPKNRKMAVRHKLQKVFVDEQERKSGGRNTNMNQPNLNNFSLPVSNMFMMDPLNQPQHTPRLPPPPYPYKQDVANNYVPSAAGAASSVPLSNATASTSTLFGNLPVQQQSIFPEYSPSVGLPSGHQQYYNVTANNNTNNDSNSFFGYNATAVDKNNANNNNRSFGYNATAVDKKNANNNSSFSYNVTAVNNNNSYFGSNAPAVNNNNNRSFGYNDTTVNNDNATFTFQSVETGEPQTFTYLE